MKNQKYAPLSNLSLKKSNELVSAKYKSTLLENQVMAIALTRIEVDVSENSDTLVARLYPGELKKLIGDPTHIYRTLKSVSKTMTGHSMILEDGKGNFNAFAIVNNADYVDGVFTVEFNKKLKDHILGLEKNYTTLELSVLTDFKRNSSFRLYELLKREIYKSDPRIDGGRVQIEYNISELRFMIGLANIDDQGVKNAMARMGNDINWDELYLKLDKKDRKYEAWGELQRCVIRPAQEELIEKSNIRFEYEGLREGRKMARILFSIYPNKPKNEDIIDERQRIIEANAVPNRQLEMPMDTCPEIYEEFVGHNKLAKEDIDLLLQKAAFDKAKVRKAIEMADSKQDMISNYMGFLIRCIEENWTNVETIEGSVEQAQKVIEIQKNVEKDRSNIAQRVWEKTKSREEFPDFEKEIIENGLDMEQIEIIYQPDELVKLFTNWKMGNGFDI